MGNVGLIEKGSSTSETIVAEDVIELGLNILKLMLFTSAYGIVTVTLNTCPFNASYGWVMGLPVRAANWTVTLVEGNPALAMVSFTIEVTEGVPEFTLIWVLEPVELIIRP